MGTFFGEDTSTDHQNRKLRMILSGGYGCFIITNGIKSIKLIVKQAHMIKIRSYMSAHVLLNLLKGVG